jgi:aspartate carbamoyltransferase regulatory subunit
MGEGLLVRKIRFGTVIDHIPAGNALNVVRILGINGDEGIRLAIIMNTESSKLGRKDIVKIEGRELTMDELNIIALIAPTATINIIRDYEVYRKEKVSVPDYIEGIIRCSNPSCISNQGRETAKPKFRVVSKEPLTLECIYCERYTSREEIVKQFISHMGV